MTTYVMLCRHNISIAYPDEGAWKRFHPQLSDYPEVVCTKIRKVRVQGSGRGWSEAVSPGQAMHRPAGHLPGDVVHQITMCTALQHTR